MCSAGRSSSPTIAHRLGRRTNPMPKEAFSGEGGIEMFEVIIEAVVEAVLTTLAAVSHQCVFLSFAPEVVLHLESVSKAPSGWVIPEWNDQNREIAETLDPQWLFCNRKRLPIANRDVWQGDWNWVLYTINEMETGEKLGMRGFRYLETDRILDILHGQA